MHQSANGNIWLEGNTMVAAVTVPNDFPENPLSVQRISYRVFDINNGLPSIDIYNLFITNLYNKQTGIQLTNNTCFKFNPAQNTWQQVLPGLQNQNPESAGSELVYDSFRQGYWGLFNQSLQLLKNGKVQQQLNLPDLNILCNRYHISSRHFYADKEGNLWMLAMYNNGRHLYRIIPSDVNHGKPPVAEPLFKDEKAWVEFKSLLPDKQGTIWLGTVGHGLVQLVPKPKYFTHYLAGHSINSIRHIPNSQNLYIQKGSTAYRFQPPNTLETTTITFQNKQYPAVSMLAASGGAIIVRSIETTHLKNHLLYCRLPNGTEQMYILPESYFADPLFEDRQRRVWLAGSMGIFACLLPNADTLLTYSYQHVLQTDNSNLTIKQMYQSADDNFWIATQQGLLQMAAPLQQQPTFKRWKTDPNNPYSLSSNAIMAVLDDPAQPERFLWVATNGNGLNKMDKTTGNCIHFTKNNGLPDNVVYGILADSLGRLWLSTNFGLSCFTPQTNHFRNFTAEDGLQDNEFNNQSFFKDEQGTMYFGGINGLTAFKPESILPDANLAPVFFTELKINNQFTDLRDSLGILQLPLEFSETIYLKYYQNFLTISYATLNYAQKNNSTYYYKLDGIDKDWVFANHNAELSYPNLAPGHYTLQVANVNQSGLRNPHPATLQVVITPPWWRSRVAYITYALLLLAAIAGAFRFQANRLKLQNQLLFKQKEAQNLQALDELKTRFFTNITHEFRTPLTLILEPVKQLLQNPKATDFSTQHRIILNNATRLLALVNQLLDLSKLEDGKLQTNWVEGDLLLILREIYDYFLPLVHKKNQTLVWQTKLTELQGVTDRQMLEKITYNLLSNAHKFTPNGGKITLRIGQTDPNFWTLTVEDSGIGMAPENLPHIFDRFYQTDNSLTRRGEGTGIGLALVKELCQLLNAQISVNSEPGKGTEFTLTFPLYPQGAVAANTLSAAGKLAFKEILEAETQPIEGITTQPNKENANTVLLVEDNAEMRQYLTMVLTQHGYAIAEAPNGKQGLELARQIMPDLIITDVMMPEMDGYQMTQLLKSDAVTSHIPIVILTAKGRTESKIEGYRRGADAYLPKPFSTEELLVRLAQLLHMRRLLQEKFAQATLPNATQTLPHQAEEEEAEKLLSDIDRQWLQTLRNAIQEKLPDEHFIVDNLLPTLFMSRTQFYAKVKALTGETPARLLRNARLDKAYQLLAEQPGLRIQEVVLMVGLNDTKHFAVLFKERFGILPQQLIRK
ncbi:hypothetical protein C7N43_09435 [Sphingobacteriales bacterium UPWRP_1]|nr:hypothetical protein B6N25_06840 [Sphingobacteriales bacterium TSM_CSS]PSJ77259.1 hypothetical protein C7N43_09435 [Sphingobacteriales bacterium UPWRP_1]